jgi:hypothetical protein
MNLILFHVSIRACRTISFSLKSSFAAAWAKRPFSSGSRRTVTAVVFAIFTFTSTGIETGSSRLEKKVCKTTLDVAKRFANNSRRWTQNRTKRIASQYQPICWRKFAFGAHVARHRNDFRLSYWKLLEVMPQLLT